MSEPTGARAGLPKRPEGPRLRDAMPRPLLIVLLAFSIVALAVIVVLLIRPPVPEEVALEDRRPPPAGAFSHDVIEVFELPRPSPLPGYEPPCPAVETLRPVGGQRAVERLTRALRLLCTVAGPGVPQILPEAVGGLDGVEIWFTDFRRSGVESTVDFAEDRILLNIAFAATERPFRDIVPVLLHDAWHRLQGRPPTAEQEFVARQVELEACRQLIHPRDWPRGCTDARDLVEMGEARAVALLVRAGYESGRVS